MQRCRILVARTSRRINLFSRLNEASRNSGGQVLITLSRKELQQVLGGVSVGEGSSKEGPEETHGSDRNPIRVKVVGKKGEMIVNLLFVGATLLLVLAVAYPYLSNRSSVTPDVVGDITFDDVQGCDEAKADVMEIVDFLQNPDKYAKVKARLPKGLLLTGPPGTGKTMLAKAIAGSASCSFFSVSGAEMDKIWVGSGSQRVREIFKEAREKAPSVIFIDEIDAVGGKRGEHPSHQGIYKQTLNQLLTEMDGLVKSERIVVVAATNRPDTLDPALTRPGRFDKQVRVDLPDVAGRAAILKTYLKKVPQDPDVSVQKLAQATTGLAGADLSNLVNQAAIKAAQEVSESVTQDHLDFAKDKILMGTEHKSRVVPDNIRKLTAYHEGGHTLVCLNTPGSMPLYKVTIVPRGMAGGLTQFLPESDQILRTRKEMEAQLRVAMGGRVAEELVFGKEETTSGAVNDFTQATRLAHQMVQGYGFGSMGPMDFVSMGQSGMLSEAYRAKIDDEVQQILKTAYADAKTCLEKRMPELHALANALLQKESLNASEVDELLKSFKK